MMTRQARESLAPQFQNGHVLRTYPANSPRAMARLLVLALLADGRLDKAELEGLSRRDVYAVLGLSREDFVGVLFDFCSDVAQLRSGEGSYHLTPAVIERLLAEIDQPAIRKALMRLIFDVICSDGKLAEGEERLFWSAVEAWKLHIADVSGQNKTYRLNAGPPENYYS